jgi:hypothetical protein
VKDGYSLAFGARFLKRVIDDRIKLPISEFWQGGPEFRVLCEAGKVVVESSGMRLLKGAAVA